MPMKSNKCNVIESIMFFYATLFFQEHYGLHTPGLLFKLLNEKSDHEYLCIQKIFFLDCHLQAGTCVTVPKKIAILKICHPGFISQWNNNMYYKFKANRDTFLIICAENIIISQCEL